MMMIFSLSLSLSLSLSVSSFVLHSTRCQLLSSLSMNQIGARADAALQAMIAAHFLVREEVVVDEDAAAAAAAAAARCVCVCMYVRIIELYLWWCVELVLYFNKRNFYFICFD